MKNKPRRERKKDRRAKQARNLDVEETQTRSKVEKEAIRDGECGGKYERETTERRKDEERKRDKGK